MTADRSALLAGDVRGGFDPRADRGRRLRRRRARPADRARLGWQMEANWTDPLLFFIYSVAKPLASALILVVMLEVISGGGNARVPRVRGRRQRAVVVRAVRDRRPRLVDPRRPRALPDAEVRVRQPERLPASCCSAAASPGSRSARWAPRSRSRSASSSSACRSTSARSTGRCSSSSWSSGSIVDRRARRAARRDLPPDAPGVVVVPRGRGRRAVPHHGVVFPLAVLPVARSRSSGC